MSADFVKLNGTPKLSVSLTITMSDTSTKTLVIREGDRVTNLSYISYTGKMCTVTGDVKVIRFNASSRQVTPECVHDTTSDFSKRVAVTDLVIDCSDPYNSDIRVVPISSIRDFESDDLGEDMVISDAKLVSDNQIAFISTVDPVAVVWNGEVVLPKQEDPNVPVYTATVTTMKNQNTLVVLNIDNRCRLNIPGISPTCVLGSELSSSISTTANAFIKKYFNKFTDNLDVEVPDEEFYVTVAEGVTPVEEITIGDTTYRAGSSVLLNIGTGSRVNKEAFKIVDKKLMISPFILILQSDSYGGVIVNVNGFELSCTTGMTQEPLEVSNPEVTGGEENCENSLSVEDGVIYHTRQDGTAGIRVSLNGSNDNIAGTNVLVKSTPDLEDSTIEYAIIALDETYVNLPESDLEGYVSTEKTYTVDHKIASIKGYGSTTVEVTTVETVYERKTELIIGGTGSDYATIAEAVDVLEDGDTLTLNSGVYADPLTITKAISIIGAEGADVKLSAPINITASEGSVVLENVAVADITSAEGTGSTKTTAKGNGVVLAGGCDVVLNGVTVSNANNFYNVINIDTTGKVEITGCNFETCDSYHMIEFAYNGSETKDGTVISNCNFGKVSHNVISMYKFEEGATITIKDCTFARSANAVRLSNLGDNHATFNFENLTYNETDASPWDGLLIIQDDREEDYSQFTFNFKNVAYAPVGGEKIVFTSQNDPVGGQLWYIYKSGDVPYAKGQPNVTYSA